MNKKQGKKIRNQIKSLLAVVLLIGIASAIGWFFREVGFPETNIVVVYLLSVMITAMITNGYVYAILVSVAATFAFNYFFTAPYHSFAVNDPSYFITFFIMTVTAILTSTLTIKVQKSVQESKSKERETKALYQLTSRLTEALDTQQIIEITLRTINQALQCQATFLSFDDDKLTAGQQQEEMNSAEPAMEIPVSGDDRKFGVLRINRGQAELLTNEQLRLLHSMLECSVLAMDKIYSEKQHVKTQQEIIQERYRSNLLRAISHDLRTPLSGIMGTSEMIMDMSKKEDPRYQLAKGIHKDANWLHALVENILSLTRLREGRLTIEKELEAAEEIVGSAIRKMDSRAPEYDITVDIPKDVLMIPMDAKLIMQVLINLLDNAVKHTCAGEEISIRVWKDEEHKQAVFTVADRGEGIKNSDLPNIFQMFYTSKTTLADAKKGIGLGLTICESIITAHGGTMRAQNRTEGKGAEFTFTLPLDSN